MHESIKAREIEQKIRKKARNKGLKEVKNVVIKIGRGEGESREDIVHILKQHMNLDDFKIIEQDAAIKCRECGKIVYDKTAGLGCPDCGSIKLDILKGIGFEVVDVN